MTPPPPPSSASAPAPAPPPPTTTTTRRYAVLYYKRSFGSSASSTSTSKNRGNTARSDGILTIAPPPSCMCQLLTTAGDGDHHEEEEDESEEEENDSEGDGEDDDGGGSTRGGTKKQKWNKFKNRRQQQTAKQKKNRSKQRQQQRPNAIVWSGVNTDLSRRAYQHDTMTGNMATMTTTLIRENDTLVLNGQWACEIVSLLDYHHSDTVATTTGATSSVATSSLDGRNVGLMNRGCNSSSTTMVMKQPSHLLSQVLVGGKLGKCGNSMATTNLVKGGGLKNDHASSNSMTMPRAPLSSVRANVIQQPLRSKKTVAAVGLGHGHGHGSPRTTELTTRRVGLGSGSCHASVCKSTTTATLSATATAVTADVRGTTSDRKRQKDAPDGKDDDADDESDGEDCDHDKHETHGGNPSSSKIPPSLLRSTTTFAKRPRTAPTLVSSTSLSLSGNDIRNNTGMNDFPGAKGERINVPTSLRNILRPHQREGIAFLWNCVTGVNDGLKNAYRSARSSSTSGSAGDSLDEDDDDDDDGIGKGSSVSLSVGDVPRGAVLADEMGLGKTLMTIATIFAYHRLHRDRRFIVVCPSSLVSNWSKEFDKWLGKASQPKRIVVRNGAESEGLRNLKSFVPLKPNQSEVLILSYEIFRLHVKVIHKARQIGILVVDEGHRLKNTSGSQILTALNSIDVEARILITGTPIQNNLSEFYNVANFAVPGILGDLSTFRRLYERPMSQANQKNASTIQKDKGRRQSKALDAITSQFVLRRMQKDILKSLLPPRTEILLFCRPTDRQCEMYQSIAHRASKSIGSIGGIDDCNNPLMLLTELRKLCTHPALLDNTDEAADASLSGKLGVLSNLLDSIRRNNPTDKVVIVSNFTSALTVIETSILRKKGLSFLRLDGSTDNKSRGALVDTFNNCSVEHSFAFLLSSKAGGCGLNLIGANRLICVDADWNPATDVQAMARVYRQGQTKPCFIYRMFTTGTVEEVIYQRQLQKGNLAKLANDGGSKRSGNVSSSFTKEELRDCFTLKRGLKCDTKQKLGSKWGDYTGVSTLNSQGCDDEPLLEICEDDALTFVRIVDDGDGPTAAADEVSSDEEEDLSESESSVSGGDQPSSSEEEEFEG